MISTVDNIYVNYFPAIHPAGYKWSWALKPQNRKTYKRKI